MRKMVFWSCIGLTLLVAACSSGRQSIVPIPGNVPQSEARSQPNLANEPIASEDESSGPLVTVAASVVVTVPSSASAAKSISIKVNTGTPVIANLSSSSPGCSGTSPVVCTISVSAITSSDAFAFKTFSGSGGTGSVLASGNVLQVITSTSMTVHVILVGTPSSIALALKNTNPRECNPATTIPLYVMVKVSTGDVIIGSYGLTVTLTDRDTSGKTSLSLSSISNSSSSVTLAYNGHPLKSATISASASGVSSVKDAILAPLQMLYVANFGGGNSITVYPSNAHGNVTPARTISGPNTTLARPSGIALDGSCNLDVAQGGANSVVVFSAGANGNAIPKRTISGSNTLLSTPHGIAVDAAGNMYVANFGGNEILEFAAGASGNATPIANISGSNTGINDAERIAIGPTGKIYLTGDTRSVLVFAVGAHGNVKPVATITDSTTAFSLTRGLTVDPSGKIYVGDDGNGNVSVFAASANGNVAPIEVISGSKTMISGPEGISIPYTSAIVVSSNVNSLVLFFSKGSHGNVMPSATIAGGNTGLNGPVGNAI